MGYKLPTAKGTIRSLSKDLKIYVLKELVLKNEKVLKVVVVSRTVRLLIPSSYNLTGK